MPDQFVPDFSDLENAIHAGQDQPAPPDYGANKAFQDVINTRMQTADLFRQAMPGNDPYKDLDKKINSLQGSAESYAPVSFDPVAENLDRYKNSKFFKDTGFMPGEDNEERYARQQSTWDKMSNAVIGGAKIAGYQFWDQLKGWGRMADSIFNADMSKIYDQNDLADVNNKLTAIFNENPIFMSKKDQNSVFNISNIANLVQQTGFTIGAMGEIVLEEGLMALAAPLTGGVSEGVELSRIPRLVQDIKNVLKGTEKIAEVTQEASKMRKVFKLLSEFTPTQSTLEVLGEGTRANETALQFAGRGFGAFYRDLREANAAFTEARAEASSTYNQQKQDMMKDLYDSGQPITKDKLDDIEKVSRESAHANFWTNSVVIGISNRLEFDNVFRGFKGASKYLADAGPIADDAAGFFKKGINIRTLKAGLRTAPLAYFKNNLVEALQENVQNVTDQAIRGYYKARYDNPATASFGDQLKGAIHDQFNTQGAVTFISGFLTGALASPISGVAKFAYERIGTSAQQRQTHNNEVQATISKLNSYFAAENGKNMTVQASLGAAMGDAIKNGNQKEFYDLKNAAIQEFARTAIRTGKTDALFDRLDQLAKGLSQEEFEKAFGLEATQSNRKQAADYIHDLRGRVNDIQDVKEQLDIKFPNPFNTKGAKSPEEYADMTLKQHAFEEAKWHYVYMLDAHTQVLNRQAGIMKDMGEKLHNVSYEALFTLTDPKRVREEVKLSRQEAALMKEGREKTQKMKTADLLEALIPSLEKGNLHEQTFYDYVNHIQQLNNRQPVDKLALKENLQRFNDFYALKADEVKLFDNINRIVAPHSFNEFAHRHFMWQGIQDHLARVKDEVAGKFNEDDLKDIKEKYPDHDINIDAEGNLNVAPKEGVAVDTQKQADIIDEVTKKVEEKVNAQVPQATGTTESQPGEDQQKQDALAKQKAETQKKIEARIKQIYNEFLDKGDMDDQDKDFLSRDDVKEVGANNSDYIRLMQGIHDLQSATPSIPAPPGPQTEDEEVKQALTNATTLVHNSVAYDPREASTKSNDQGQLSSTVSETGKNPKVEKNGDIHLADKMGYLRGTVARLFATNSSLFENYELVLTMDNPEWYKHADQLTDEAKAQLTPLETGPYKYFLTQNGTPGAVLLVRNKNTGDPLYVNPYRSGIIADKTTGLIAVFGLDYAALGMDRDSVIDRLSKTGEIAIDANQVSVSKGVIDSKKELSSAREFFGDQPAEFSIAKNEPGVTFDPQSKLRSGGVYSGDPKLSQIKWLPALLSQLTIAGKPVDIAGILNTTYNNVEDAHKAAEFLQTLVYQGPQRVGDHYEILSIQERPTTEDRSKYRLQMVHLQSEATQTTKDATYEKTGKDAATLTSEMLQKRMNVWSQTDSDLAVPVIKDGKLSHFDSVPYKDILLDNLFTNKVHYITPDNQRVVTPINNYFTLPGVSEQLRQSTDAKVRSSTEVAAIEKRRQEDEKKVQEWVKDDKAPDTYIYEGKEYDTDWDVLSAIEKKYDAELDALNKKEAPKTETAKDRIQKLNELKKKGKSDNEDFDALTKEKNVQDELGRRLIGNQELQFIKDRFGDQVLNHMLYAANSKYWGYWRDGVITLYNDAKEGVGYHEAWHHFSQMFLTMDQKGELYQSVMRNNPSLKTFKQVEEHLADGFRDFAESNGTIFPKSEVKRNIFQKMWDFLKHLFTGTKTLEDYYKDLYQGKLYGYQPTLNNAVWGRLNYGFVKNGQEIFDAKELNQATGLFNTLLGRAFSKEGEGSLKDSGISLSALLGLKNNPDKRDRAVQRVYNALLDEFTDFNQEHSSQFDENQASSQVLNKMVDNYDDFFKYALGKLQIDASNIEKLEEEDLTNASTNDTPESLDEEGEIKTEALSDSEAKDIEETQYSDKVVPIQDKGLLASLSRFMRNLVLTTPRATVTYENGKATISEYRNEYGFTEPCDYYKVVNILGEELAGTFSDDELLDRLYNDKKLLQRVPELQFIRQSLPDFKSGKPFATQTIMSLMRDFNRVYTGVYSLVEMEPDESGRRFAFIEQTKNTESKIKREWQDHFLSNKADTVIDASNNRQYLAPGFVAKYKSLIDMDKTDKNQTIINRIGVLKKLGIEFSGRTTGTEDFRSMILSSAFNYYMNSIAERQRAGQFIENPVTDVMRGFYSEDGKTKIPGEARFLTNMLRFEAQYSDRVPSNMYKTAKGTNKYALMLPNELNIIGDALRSAQKISDVTSRPELSNLFDPKNYFAKHSLVLNSLFDSRGLKVTDFEFGDYNSAVIRAYDKKVERQTTELEPRDKLIMDMNSLLNHGVIDVMRTGSSESSYFYRLPIYRHNYTFTNANGSTNTITYNSKTLPFPISLYNEGKPTSRYRELLKGYFGTLLMDELTMMNLSEIKGAPKFAAKIKEFGIFSGIIGTEGKEDLKKHTKGLNEQQIQQFVSKVVDGVIDDVEDYLEDATKDFMNYAASWGISEKDGQSPQELDKDIRSTGLAWKDIAKLFVLNNLVLNAEYTRMISGAPQFYSDYHKRAKGQISTGNTPNTGSSIRTYLENTHGNTMSAAYSKQFNPNIDEIRKNTLEDDKAGMDKGTKEQWLKAAKQMNWTQKMMKSLIDRYEKDEDGEHPKVNDGQAYCTLDFYRRIRIQVGNWDMDKDERQYGKEVATWKLNKKLYQSEQEKADLEKIAHDPVTYSTFPVMKLQYNGALKSAGIKLPALDKFSIWPEIPSVHADKPFHDELHDWMLKSGHDYVTAKSGTKNFTTDPLKLWNDLRTRDKFNAKLSLETAPMVGHAAFLKEQIKTNGEIKSTSTWGTQLRSLFMSNFFNMGESVNGEKFQKLFNDYIGDLDHLIEIERKQLFNRLGMTEDENGGIKISNVKDFVDTIQKQAEIRNLNENIKRSIGYDEQTGKFTLPLEINTNRQAIVDLVAGMIFKKVVAIKTNGDMLIQVASTGFRRMQNGKLESDLPFYTPKFNKDGKFVGVNPAGAKVGFNKHYEPLLNLFHPDGKKIGTRERLNEAIQNDRWVEENGREITLVGYRIPTQEPNSMEIMHIKEFLPETFGSCIVVPKEIVTKSGSDFDVDKLSVFRPYYGADGKTLYDNKQELQEQAEQLRADMEAWRKMNRKGDTSSYQEFINKIFGSSYDADEAADELAQMRERFFEIDRKQKGIISNKAVDAYIQTLTSPEMFHQLIRPNSADTVKELAMKMGKKLKTRGFEASELESPKGTKILEYTTNHSKFVQNISGRNDIGLWALVNKMLQNLQVTGARMNSQFRNYFRDYAKKSMIFTTMKTTPWLLSEEERGRLGEGIPLGANSDIDGRPKQQIISELMNATLDIEKDPFYQGLGFNRYNKGVAALLLIQGVPLDRVVTFLNQKVLRDYYDRVTKEPYLPAFEGGPTVFSTNEHAKQMTGIRKRKDLEAWIGKVQNGEYASKADYNQAFDMKTMEKLLGLKSSGKDGQLYRESLLYLGHFLALQRMAKVYRQTQQLATTDTRKYATPISAEASDMSRQEVEQTQLIEKESLNRLLTKSFTSPFNMKPEVRSILGKIMPYGFSKLFIKKAGEFLSKDDLFLSKDDSLKLERTFSNDYITYIALRYGKFDGQNLQSYVRDLIYKGTKPTIAERLLELQEKAKTDPNYQKLFQFFSLASSLNTNISRTDPRIQNIELIRSLDNSTELQNEFIEEFNKLIDFKGNEVPGATFSKEDVSYIKSFFTDTALAAFGQAGFNKSRLYMTDILPIDLMHPILKEAMHDFRDMTRKDDQFQGKFIDEYIDEFQKENANLLGQTSARESWRGKYLLPETKENVVEPEQQETEKKPVTPSQYDHQIAMKFGDGSGGRKMRPEFKGKTTLQLIQEGKRTATSRDMSKSYNQHSIKVGDKIRFYDDKKNEAIVEVTKAPYPISQISREEWSKLEGWSPEVYDKLGKDYQQFQYKLVQPAPLETVKDQSTDADKALGEQPEAQYAKYLELTAGLPILEGQIKSDKTTPVAAQYLNGKIYINPEALRQKYSEKAWTNPVEQKDGSKASMVREDAFGSYEDFFRFVLLHETAHHYMKRQSSETIGAYETRINNEALQRLRQSGSPDAYDQVSFRLPEIYLKGPQTKPFETFKQDATEFLDHLIEFNPNPSKEDMDKMEDQLRCL